MLTQKQKIGEIGENMAVKHLKKRGFKILDRNYRKKWGEIDIIAEKDSSGSFLRRIFTPNKILHFIEVKSVAFKPTNQGYQPEENVHSWKQKRLGRAVKTYLLDKKIPEKMGYQIDIMAVFIDLNSKKAKIRMTENVII